jgi:hypothetical protein
VRVTVTVHVFMNPHSEQLRGARSEDYCGYGHDVRYPELLLSLENRPPLLPGKGQ